MRILINIRKMMLFVEARLFEEKPLTEIEF